MKFHPAIKTYKKIFSKNFQNMTWPGYKNQKIKFMWPYKKILDFYYFRHQYTTLKACTKQIYCYAYAKYIVKILA